MAAEQNYRGVSDQQQHVDQCEDYEVTLKRVYNFFEIVFAVRAVQHVLIVVAEGSSLIEPDILRRWTSAARKYVRFTKNMRILKRFLGFLVSGSEKQLSEFDPF